MIINSAIEFDKVARSIFEITDFHTLTGIENKLKFELGGEYEDVERGEIAFQRAISILSEVFTNNQTWIRVILWDKKNTISDLGTEINQFLKFTVEKEECKTLYFNVIYKDKYITQIVKSIINYEIGLEPYLNATCLYFNFDIPVVANVYDDRGMDVVLQDKKKLHLLKEKFSNLIVSSS